jgi:hypothetical protein
MAFLGFKASCSEFGFRVELNRVSGFNNGVILPPKENDLPSQDLLYYPTYGSCEFVTIFLSKEPGSVIMIQYKAPKT